MSSSPPTTGARPGLPSFSDPTSPPSSSSSPRRTCTSRPSSPTVCVIYGFDHLYRLIKTRFHTVTLRVLPELAILPFDRNALPPGLTLSGGRPRTLKVLDATISRTASLGRGYNDNIQLDHLNHFPYRHGVFS
ncbi:hypothetical protein K523DRAFT_422203 [Schizophyllum commune Tattone D]|nr:hypothetical protein K523DRAFT_422203 [Schizophyllum commune Tattone D]